MMMIIILSSSNAITNIIMITLTSDTNFEETLSTLKYAHTTKSVNNRPVMNIDQDPKDKMIRSSLNPEKLSNILFWDSNYLSTH